MSIPVMIAWSHEQVFLKSIFGKRYAHCGIFIQWNNYPVIKRNELQMIQQCDLKNTTLSKRCQIEKTRYKRVHSVHSIYMNCYNRQNFNSDRNQNRGCTAGEQTGKRRGNHLSGFYFLFWWWIHLSKSKL